MKNYKDEKLEFVSRVIWHSRTTADLMLLLEMNREKLPFDIPEWELVRRGVQHDLDKFEDNFPEITISYYMDEISNDDVEEINRRAALLKHNHGESCPHHIAYHIKNDIPFSNIDICEMCCDWIASSQKPRFKDDESSKSIEKMKEKFLEIVVDKNLILEKHMNEFIKIFDLLESLEAMKLLTPYRTFGFEYEV